MKFQSVLLSYSLHLFTVHSTFFIKTKTNKVDATTIVVVPPLITLSNPRIRWIALSI